MKIYLFTRKRKRGFSGRVWNTVVTRLRLDGERLFFIGGSIPAVRHALGRFSTSHLATDLWAATWPRYGRYTSVHPRAAISTASPIRRQLSRVSTQFGARNAFPRRLFCHISFSLSCTRLPPTCAPTQILIIRPRNSSFILEQRSCTRVTESRMFPRGNFSAIRPHPWQSLRGGFAGRILFRTVYCATYSRMLIRWRCTACDKRARGVN